jgi:hypothetical protein
LFLLLQAIEKRDLAENIIHQFGHDLSFIVFPPFSKLPFFPMKFQ